MMAGVVVHIVLILPSIALASTIRVVATRMFFIMLTRYVQVMFLQWVIRAMEQVIGSFVLKGLEIHYMWQKDTIAMLE